MSMRMLVSIMLAMLFLVSGAYSFEVSVYGADGGSSFSDKLTINAQEQDSLLVNSVVSGAALAQYANGYGDLHKSFAANNRRGEKASITADVVGAGYWEYYQPEIFIDPTSATVSGFGLTATEADSIKCAATAQNRLGEKASAGVQVTDGSLSNYWADAYAYSYGVGVQQSFGEASGQNIAVTERAANARGSTGAITNVQEGSIIGFSDLSETFANSQSVQSFSTMSQATGKDITSESSAYKSGGYGSNSKLHIIGTEDQDGSVYYLDSYSGEGFIGIGGNPMPTGAVQRFYGAQGDLIEVSQSASNPERDLSSTSMQVKGFGDQPGYIDYYEGYAESLIEPSTESVVALNFFEYVQGGSIILSQASSNARSDRTRIDSSLLGNSFIGSGSVSSTSGARFASGSNSLSVNWANMTDCTASASSNWMGRATVHSNIIANSGSISNSAFADSSAQILGAEQEATVFGPSLAQADATAINLFGDKDTSGWSMYVSEEYPLRYGQNASVIAGVPGVSMWAVL